MDNYVLVQVVTSQGLIVYGLKTPLSIGMSLHLIDRRYTIVKSLYLTDRGLTTLRSIVMRLLSIDLVMTNLRTIETSQSLIDL